MKIIIYGLPGSGYEEVAKYIDSDCFIEDADFVTFLSSKKKTKAQVAAYNKALSAATCCAGCAVASHLKEPTYKVFLYYNPQIYSERPYDEPTNIYTELTKYRDDSIQKFRIDPYNMFMYDLIVDTTFVKDRSVIADMIRSYAEKASTEQVILINKNNLYLQVDTYRGRAHKFSESAVPAFSAGGYWFIASQKPEMYKPALNGNFVNVKLVSLPYRIYTLSADEVQAWDNLLGTRHYPKVLNVIPNLTPEAEFRYRAPKPFKRKDVSKTPNELEKLCTVKQANKLREYLKKGYAFCVAGSEFSPKHEFLLALRREMRKACGDGVTTYDASILYQHAWDRPMICVCVNDWGNKVLLESIKELVGHRWVTRFTSSQHDDADE